GLMHREDHRRGGAGATERVADVGNLRYRGAVAAERERNLDTQKPLLTRCVDSYFRKARVAIDFLGLRRGSCCDRGRPLRERTAIDNELFADLARGSVAEPCFLHIHDRYASWFVGAKDLASRDAHRSRGQLSTLLRG